MWQVLVIRAWDYTKELQTSKDVMISNEMTSGLSCLSPSHSTASKSNIFLRPQGLIVSLGLQTKLTLSFTFKHFISYENKKALQVTMEELISKSPISQNIFFLLILLSVWSTCRMISIVPDVVRFDEKCKTDLVTKFLAWYIRRYMGTT